MADRVAIAKIVHEVIDADLTFAYTPTKHYEPGTTDLVVAASDHSPVVFRK